MSSLPLSQHGDNASHASSSGRLDAFAVLRRLPRFQQTGANTYKACCPAHNDVEPSLSIAQKPDGMILLNCFAGCSTEEVIAVLGLQMADLFPTAQHIGTRPQHIPARTHHRNEGVSPSVISVTPLYSPQHRQQGLTLETLAGTKKLPLDFLKSLGLRNTSYNALQAVRIPYLNAEGKSVSTRFRMAIEGDRFKWKRGTPVLPYGLDRLGEARSAGYILLVEGESDCWTAWYYGLPALGIPGKSTWRPEWAATLADIHDIYLWVEPDADDLIGRVASDVPRVNIIRAPEGIKDISAAHVQGQAVITLIEHLRDEAVPACEVLRSKRQTMQEKLQQKAQSVLAADDPLTLVEQAIRALGYGGQVATAVVTYLSATSRVLSMRIEALPVHLLLVGPPSAGKSYTLEIVKRLLPSEVYHVLDAASPRVLIYDSADLRHKWLIFSEADSLPAGEDNPAASAVRNLLQDHHLHYSVTVRDKDSGEYIVREINKPGPTTLVTTAVRSLGEQLMSRLFILDVPDGQEQVRNALLAQANLELNGCSGEPPDALIAFQSLLQAQAPWDVVVPYAGELARQIGESPGTTRIVRDYARLLSLVKAVTVIRHQHRVRDPQGRLVATIEDYATVYELINDMYVASVSGVSQKVRDVVSAVREMTAKGDKEITVTIMTPGNRTTKRRYLR